jgi:hypothetical protein
VLPRSTKTILQRVVDFTEAKSPASTPARLAPGLRQPLRLAAPYLFGSGEGIEARLPFDFDF